MSATNTQRATTGTVRRTTRNTGLRRAHDSRLGRFLHRMGEGWGALLEVSPFWIVLFLAVATWSLLPRTQFFIPKLVPGEIAGRTILAERDLTVADEAETRRVQARVRQEVRPVYDLDRGLEAVRRLQLAELFTAGRSLLADRVLPAGGPVGAERLETAAQRLQEASSLAVTPEQTLLFRDWELATELEDRLAGILSRLLRRGVVDNREQLLEHRAQGITVRELPGEALSTQLDLYGYLDYPDQVREVVDEDLGAWGGLPLDARRHFADFIVANVVPNLILNRQETVASQQRALGDAEPIYKRIRKGEVIVRRGDQITELEAGALAEMIGEREASQLLLTVLGTALLLAVSALAVWLGIGADAKTDRSRRRLFHEGLLLLLLHIVGARFAYFTAQALAGAIEREPFGALDSYTYAIPFASLALHASLLFGRHPAFVLSLVFSLLAGRLAPSETEWLTVAYSIAGSFAAITAVERVSFRQRSATTLIGVWVGLANVLTMLMLKALTGATEGGLLRLGFDLLCAFGGGLLAAVVASFAVPLLESLLSVTTHIKLLELANSDLPLLRRLALEAPGSFQHSLAVANLAKAGCEAIGADAIQVNTCALYHDVGKIVRPHYFIENQIGTQNPHDKVQPSMSALILINHVKEGLELARKARLPQPILDAIEQHHGTRLIKFFYNRAQERADRENDEIREEEFRYPGPKPQNKEMGVLMLADAVEAASRTLVEPNRQRLRTMLRAIFDDCLKDRQLEETDLTLGDLRQVEEAFLRVLTNIYHRRIDYPGFDFNRDRKKRRGDSTEELTALDLTGEPARGSAQRRLSAAG